MQSVLEVLQSIGVFTLGILARFGLFLAMVAVIVVPALIIALVVRGRAERRERALGIRDVDGVPFRPDLFYAPGHLWLHRRPGGRAVELGLDGIAQRLMPAVTAVDLARPGTRVARGETIATLHGGGRALEIPAPVDGTVVGVNVSVVRDPALVKRDGYGRGWLVALAPVDEAYASMPRAGAAESWMRREAQRWNHFVEHQLGFAAADGGTLVAPAPWLVGEEGWAALTQAFLRP
ncbi:glycine cleavage H-protein [Anaeromyxobacter sp. K]|uniref:glycine cleavage system protein H n=1 Tax=Anaeromyxobacter sp. (strain K) TaxID=447217 RepID=UPI00015F90E4|nr:glycine cleavage system protein H [Anaeromyxobacter sp. K]ACG73103.1 glycine cleavage H-protein [Anaeromyxobacter sp. K]